MPPADNDKRCFTRRRFLGSAAGAVAASALARAGCAAGAPRRAGPRRPNILLMVTDDQRADAMSCAGHPLLATPNMDRLAAEGVRFTHAFVTTSICSASRASIISGWYASRHGVGMGNQNSGTLPEKAWDESFPVQLKRAGYRIGCLGKWGFNCAKAKDLFDTWFAWAGQGTYFHDVDGEKVHNAEMLARKAEAFLRAGPADQPFALIVYYKGPHAPFKPDPRDADLFKDSEVPPPKTYTEAHFRAKPEIVRTSLGRSRLMKRHPTSHAYQDFAKRYLRCVASVDRSVGKILGTLDALGLADDTAVIFSSDNGFFLGEHGLSGKWLAYEESIRVPLLVRWGGLPAAMRGKTVEAFALNVDIAPTILDLAGLAAAEAMDGRSLRPLLTGAGGPWREDLFYEHHYHHKGTIPRTEAVRGRRFKYIRYFDPDPDVEELYDLSADPHEEHDLAADPAHAGRLAAMRRRWQELRGPFQRAGQR